MEVKEKTTKTTTKKSTKKAAKEGAVKKPPTPQISLTFKRNSPIEMALYSHLQSKFYQGAYIKELLINQMLRERPDLVEMYNLNMYLDSVEQQQKPPITEHTGTYNPSTGETTFNDEAINEEVADEQQEETTPEPSGSLNEGLMATLGEFL